LRRLASRGPQQEERRGEQRKIGHQEQHISTRADAQHDSRRICHTLVHSKGVIDREKGEHRRKQHELTTPARRACRMESCAKGRRKDSGDAQPVEKVALVHGCDAPCAVCGDVRGAARPRR
jgi:hypothetical protein